VPFKTATAARAQTQGERGVAPLPPRCGRADREPQVTAHPPANNPCHINDRSPALGGRKSPPRLDLKNLMGRSKN
jgi:hypothetical protein